MRYAYTRREIADEARNHRDKKKRAGGDKKQKAFPQMIKLATVPKNDAGGDGESDKIETSDENNVQRADAIDRQKCNDDKAGQDRHDSRAQRVREKRAAAKWQSCRDVNCNGGDANPAADLRQIDNINGKRPDDECADERRESRLSLPFRRKRGGFRQFRRGQVEQTPDEKRRHTQDGKKHETFVEQRAAKLICAGILGGFRTGNQRRAYESANKPEPDKNKIRRRRIFALPKPLSEGAREDKQTNNETNITSAMRVTGVSAVRKQVERKDRCNLAAREMRCRRDSWTGRSEKSKDEGCHESLNHQPRMRNVRIWNSNAEIKEQPERYAKYSKQRASRKENPKRFFATHPQELSRCAIFDLEAKRLLLVHNGSLVEIPGKKSTISTYPISMRLGTAGCSSVESRSCAVPSNHGGSVPNPEMPPQQFFRMDNVAASNREERQGSRGPTRVTALQQPQDQPAALSLPAMTSQYFTGDMMPERAIRMQRCKQFRCAPHAIRVGRSEAAGKCTKATASRLRSAGKMRGNRPAESRMRDRTGVGTEFGFDS
jgi:hypothetical protein